MANAQNTQDVRWERLANLSVQIRMLKARVLAAFEEQEPRASASNDCDAQALQTFQSDPTCPFCGHSAGLALVPREYRRPTTPVRCFACHRDAPAGEWAIPTAPMTTPARSGGGTFSPRTGR